MRKKRRKKGGVVRRGVFGVKRIKNNNKNELWIVNSINLVV